MWLVGNWMATHHGCVGDLIRLSLWLDATDRWLVWDSLLTSLWTILRLTWIGQQLVPGQFVTSPWPRPSVSYHNKKPGKDILWFRSIYATVYMFGIHNPCDKTFAVVLFCDLDIGSIASSNTRTVYQVILAQWKIWLYWRMTKIRQIKNHQSFQL